MSFELLPPEERKRRLENYMAAVLRDRRQSRVAFWLGASIGTGLAVAAILGGWSPWIILASIPLMVGPGLGWHLHTSRRTYVELAKLDIRCPHCKQPLHTVGLGGSAANEEMSRVASGFCPRCYGQLPAAETELSDAVLETLT